MMNLNNISADKFAVTKAPTLPMARMLTSALPFVALAVPGTVYAQSAENTATITAPAGAIETNTANNSATDSDTVFAALVANNDSATGQFGGGATGVVNILGNDTINGGTPVSTDVDISVASGSSLPSQLTFDTATGDVGVTANTPAGVYTFDYTICEAGTSNCTDATVTVTVEAPVIAADNDSVSAVNGLTGGADLLDVLDGDTIGGAGATTTNVDLTVLTPATAINGGPVPTLDVTDGLISVPAGTPAGDYTIAYQICDAINPGVCDDAVATVNVIAATIVADDDSITGVDGTAGGTNILNALEGDTLGGNQAPLSDVTLSVLTPAAPINGGPVPALDPSTGFVSVPAGTPAGTYTITYEVCEDLNAGNCDEATISVTVAAPTIVADADSVTGISSVTGGNDVLDVIDGDTLDGNPITAADVNISVLTGATPINGGPVPTLNTTTGLVSVDPNTPAGVYEISYQICDPINPTVCDNALASVTVEAPAIFADDDSLTGVDGAAGAADALDVLDGDTFNGAPFNAGDVTLSVTTGATPINGGPVPTLNTATGLVSIPAGTPAGTYTITYQICDPINPANCDTGVATVEVIAAVITADADSVSGLNGVTGGADVLDVLDGDTIGGAPATPGNVDLTVLTPATPINGGPVPTLDPSTGLITLPASTPAGTYEIEYQICDPLNPTNCATETATVVVAPSVDLSITKSNGVDNVTSGQSITYTLVVSNAGPDAAVGPVLRDVPGAGLSCPVGNPVTFTGDGAPSGSFTIGDLTGPGITLGTLISGGSATITYTCSVD
ncbi:DUF11 domain-containing protein [Erythrobacter insulae]|uniref:DUF11 domain-containing protein n=1 Tax=Erythrobacter insulae TaxID=2584124 RepID=A0A547PCU0_9SPHN|nr:DUF11 domain-containing protein [Erythrobacter insulae]TRD11945.1 DUF11 domain-containing protein [Erythrobacter insulae]